MKNKVYISTLGCSKNLVDSEMMLSLLKEDGIEKTDDLSSADLAVVNTCGFIESAKEESISEILDIARYKEIGKLKHLIVAGCLSQRYSEDLKNELPEVDAFIGTTSFEMISQIVKGLELGQKQSLILDINRDMNLSAKRELLTESYSAFIKIAEGCDNLCTYCIIPKLRGGYRSRRIEDIIEEAKMLAENGVKEIILIAQDTTKYGLDLYNEKRIAQLLRELSKIEKIKWIRFLYSYPEDIDEELVKAVKESEKVCSYFDMPIQHSHDNVLKRMNRKTTQEDIISKIELIRSEIPNAVIRTTLISGFPQESEEEFEDMVNFVSKIKFDRLGVFTYSKEEGTPAANMKGHIDQKTKEYRQGKIMEIQQRISLEKNQEYIGKTMEVLIEKNAEDNVYEARSFRDAPEIDGIVFVKSKNNLEKGSFVKVKINDAMEYDLIGDEIE